MCQLNSLGLRRELSLIVVRETLSALPYEFTLDGCAEIPRHGRDEDQIAGHVHGRIGSILSLVLLAIIHYAIVTNCSSDVLSEHFLGLFFRLANIDECDRQPNHLVQE